MDPAEVAAVVVTRLCITVRLLVVAEDQVAPWDHVCVPVAEIYPNVCVPVNVCAASVRAMVALVPGNVIVVPSVPAKVRVLLNVSVLAAAPVKVYVPVVSVLPLILVAATVLGVVAPTVPLMLIELTPVKVLFNPRIDAPLMP